MTRMPRTARIAGMALVPLVATAATVLPAAPVTASNQCASPGSTISQVPWPQQMYDPQQVWPFSTGAGIDVAVVDTGVDGHHKQLSGHVTTGTSVAGGGNGDSDCAGHGTGVAGVIAGQAVPGIGMRGLAPGATILPVQAAAGNGSSDGTADPAALAKGIDWAAGHNASVIVVSLVSYQDSNQLRTAVTSALNDNIVVVAAAGDQGKNGNPQPYPASYPGVLAVSGIDQNTSAPDGAGSGSFVGLAAPSEDVVVPQAGSGWITAKSTAYAAGFVGATAALVRSRWSNLSADEVVRRLEATADPAPEQAGRSTHYGYGIVDPYQAVTEQLASGAPKALPGLRAAHQDAAGQAFTHSRNLALVLTLAAVLLLFLLIAVAVVLPRARRRRWRTGYAEPPYDDPDGDQPLAPVQLFKDA